MKKNGNGVSSGGAKVTVACKVPLGVVLHVDTRVVRTVEVQGQPRDIVEYARGSQNVQIRGPAYPRGEPPEGFPDKPPITGGFALTSGVDKDFWDAWWTDNADPECKPEDGKDGHRSGCRCSAIVKSRMIFAYESVGDTRAAATEAKNLNSGLEPLRPEGDYRAPRPLAGISQIKPERAPLPNDA